jgi:hypothetical protein
MSIADLLTCIGRTLDRGFESHWRHGCTAAHSYVCLAQTGQRWIDYMEYLIGKKKKNRKAIPVTGRADPQGR